MMNKWTSMTITLILLGLIGQPLLASPQAGSVKKGAGVTLAPVPIPSRTELMATYSAAESKLQQVQGKIRAAQYGSAYREALEILNDVKQKVGINPFAKFREKIDVTNILHANDLTLSFSQLSNNKKEQIARAVYTHYNGQYIHLLNLMKRARVMYVYAYYEANKSNLYERDTEKLKRDLVNAHNIPILIQDKKLGEAFMLFDLDVADEDIQFSFNKEIMDVAINVLNLTEQEFEQLLQNSQTKKINEHKKGLTADIGSVTKSKRHIYYTSFVSGRNTCAPEYTPGVASDIDYVNRHKIQCILKSQLSESYKTMISLSCASGYADGNPFDIDYVSEHGKHCYKL